jgi:hypothetical protein
LRPRDAVGGDERGRASVAIDEPRRQLRYVNAGHNAPYLLRAGQPSTADAASGEIEQLTAG